MNELVKEIEYKEYDFPTAGKRKPVVCKITSSGCHEVINHSPSSTGYVNLHRLGLLDGAHRYSWRKHHGDIPDGLFVLHKCDNRRCINPDHLFLGTRSDNSLDMLRKGRCAHRAFTEDEIRHICRTRGEIPGRRLAEEYGVSESSINRIRTRKGWSFIDVPDCGKNQKALPRGSKNHFAKLSDDDVRAIRSLVGKFTQEEIARRFNVARRTVGMILAGKTWTHLTPEEK